jgi:hypothetical protein
VAVAVAAALLHSAGLVLAVTAMQPGTALHAAEARVRWLAARPAGWMVGWSVWILCALSLLALLALLNERLPRRTSLGAAAVSVAAAGAAVDIFCNALWIGFIPELAAAGPDRVFLAAERALTLGGTVTANGLYSMATLAFTLLLPPAPEWRLARLMGLVTAASGIGLCVAGLGGRPYALALFSGLTIAAFVAWALALATVRGGGLDEALDRSA